MRMVTKIYILIKCNCDLYVVSFKLYFTNKHKTVISYYGNTKIPPHTKMYNDTLIDSIDFTVIFQSILYVKLKN